MRKKLVGFGLLVLGLFGLVLGGAAAYMGTSGPNPEAPRLYQDAYGDYYAPLSGEEENGLLYMVEEEKLARDVYLTLYNETGLEVFERIAESEQTHMDAVLSLMEKYNLTAPTTLDQVGVFQNEELQSLYNQLVEQGSQSEVDALKVGALIEETDIKDLENWTAQTDNEDIKEVYSHLMAGSENHLRAFTTQLDARGVSYTAQVLPQGQVDEILSEENGHGKMRGEGHRMAGRNDGAGNRRGMHGEGRGHGARGGGMNGPRGECDGSGMGFRG